MLPWPVAAGLWQTPGPAMRVYEVVSFTDQGAAFTYVRSPDELRPGSVIQLDSGPWQVERADEVEGDLLVRLWCSPALA